MNETNPERELRREAARKANRKQAIIAVSAVGLIVAAVVGFLLFMPPHKETEVSAVSVDFTSMSDTIRSAKIIDVYTNWDMYVGKTVRIKGKYFPLEEGEHYVNVGSDQSCCLEGFKFILNGNGSVAAVKDEEINLTGAIKAEPSGNELNLYLAVDKIS